ncbi:MAG: bifunctional pyr operon transcriptional regulator/uracil phosphoribosyltransferase PyrR [Oscillospiraceae bacterium]|nr:bifunctional pyr operon transcriptional regulator/uracil phosphoribosyltransferase PyrR [Oscillospiraceae bacterium]MDY2847773.1 bifunctional pyr operon transcriptional regulator/uracil phosphoribosyltransferase PyrR [Oscillospiraceae bacterium]
MVRKAVIMDENQIKRAVARISYEIAERNRGTENLVLIGIMSRGVYIAERIAAKLKELEDYAERVGVLDITSFRDDDKNIPDSDKTDIPFDIKDKSVVLVDDVMFTGRSCRAAIDAVMSRGRPKNIQLAVLVDRGHRELPLRPDYVGKNVPTSRDESVQVMVREIDGCDMAVILE